MTLDSETNASLLAGSGAVSKSGAASSSSTSTSASLPPLVGAHRSGSNGPSAHAADLPDTSASAAMSTLPPLNAISHSSQHDPFANMSTGSVAASAASNPASTAVGAHPHALAPLPRVTPLKKLTVFLIKTYREVNERYYERKARKKKEAEEAAKKAATTSSSSFAANSATNSAAAAASSKPKFNNGWDDENFDMLVTQNDPIGEHYRMLNVLGKGSFGQVVRAEDRRTNEMVAIKVIKSKRPFFEQARTEISVLSFLNQRDPHDQHNIVRMTEHFVYRNHQCIVFELLSYNLYDLLKDTRFHGVSLNLIRKFAKQLLVTLDMLLPAGGNSLDDKSSPGVIHCDLKPENILLRNPKRSAIKVIDFGSSCYTNDRMYTYIQSRFYRAPEVLLGLSYSHPIDMWSLGCILVELHTGEPIFSGSDEFEQVCYQTALLGQPPKNILEAGRKVKNFFSRAPNGDFVLRERKNSRGETVHYRQRHLKDILGVETGGPFGRRRDEKTGHTVSDYLRFEDLIERMLDWSAETRITPAQAMQHPFFKTEGDTMASSVASPTAAMQVMQVDDDHSTSTAATATAAHLSTPARGSAQSTPGTTPSPSSSSSVSTSLMSASAAAAAAAPHGHSTNSNAGGSTTLTNMLNAQPNFAMLPPAQQHQLVQLLIPVSQGAYLDTHTLAALPATHQAVVQQFIAEQARHRRFPAQTANAMATLLTANNGGRQSGGSGSTSGVARSRSGSGDMAS